MSVQTKVKHLSLIFFGIIQLPCAAFKASNMEFLFTGKLQPRNAAHQIDGQLFSCPDDTVSGELDP